MPFHEHDGASVFYTDQGSKDSPPILFLHGWSCDSHDWSFQIPVLLKHGMRVVAMDHRGHGRSSAPRGPLAYSPYKMAADAVSLLEHLQTGPVVLVGHSMSSIVASVLTVKHSQWVKALVVVQPIYGGIPPRMPIMAGEMRADFERIQQMAVDFFDLVMYTPRTPDWIRVWNMRRLLGNDPEGIVGCLEGIIDLDGKVVGREPAAMEFMRKRNENAPRLAMCALPSQPPFEEELGVVEGRDEVHLIDEGTFLMQVMPEHFNKILLAWLQKREILPAQKIS
ncbi:hypothetical protein MBLNU230_g3503t1 [Neophaeotheca triangularis]